MNFPSPDLVPGESRVNTQWRQINEARNGARYLDGHRRRLQETIAERRRRFSMSDYDFHPFAIYLAQLAFANENNPVQDQTVWWRTFLVRSGEVNYQPLAGDGCDGWDTNPYDDYIPQETGNDDSGKPLIPITAPAGEESFYFWIELSQTKVPQLRSGTDPTTAAAPIINPWANFPNVDGVHFLIGEINTQTNEAAFGPAIIRQYLTADIPPGLLIGGCDQTGAPLSVYLPYAYVQTPPK